MRAEAKGLPLLLDESARVPQTAVGVVLVIALMGAPALVALAGAGSLRQALQRAALIGGQSLECDAQFIPRQLH